MQDNGAPYNDPRNRFDRAMDDDEMDDDFDFLDNLDDDETRRPNARRRAAERDYRPNYGKPGRRPASEREGAFNALMWMLDGATGMVEELRHNDLGLPEDFWVHAYAARREGLMAMRAILNDWIDDDASPSSPPTKEERPKRRGGIDIDF
jgi:hypothetical protein